MDKHVKNQNIGRFEIGEILGKGSQSEVYLAYDPHLQRQVAIKTLHFAEAGDKAGNMQTLLQEARTVSKLQHPNIVPIFEAGEHAGDPYLVFEYIEGQTLAELLRKKGALPVEQALGIAIQVLDGIACAHQQQIIHRDLKPSNILINKSGVPRVMDFGIATRISGDNGKQGALMGTPSYMAPEYIGNKMPTPQGDLFAVGMILYEMLAGKQAVRGADIHQVMQKIVNDPIRPPSKINDSIDEKLDDIVLKALAKEPLDRYEDASLLKQALEAYLEPADDALPKSSEDSKQSTLEFLPRRMRHKSDFPALSEAVSAINKIVSSDMESISKLSNSILKDFALTNKLLKLVNSVYYNQFGGGTVSTVSRAVVILGFDAVRNIAITLVLFENLQNKTHAAQLKDDFVRALFSGILAKEMAGGAQVKDAEEAFICAMFHNLGRLLSMFYFPEESEEIRKLMQQKNYDEDRASTKVLGISYQELGVGIARNWGFPDQIVLSMQKLPDDKVKKGASNADKLRVLSGFSNELCKIIADTPHEERHKDLRKVISRFGDAMPISENRLTVVMEKSLAEIVQFSRVVSLNLQHSPFAQQVNKWAGIANAGKEVAEKTPAAQAEDDTNAALAATVMGETAHVNDDATMVLGAGEAVEEAATPAVDAQMVLTAGIQDISNSLVEEGCALNDILRMILETMYRSMGFTHVLLCIKDGAHNTMNARFGFGQDIAQLTKSFKFSMQYAPDVFHIALDKGADILITDINDEKIAARIPEWYRTAITAQTFVLFPILLKGKPVALIYADRSKAGEIVIPENQLSLLKTLRNQAVLAIKQSL